ncbi:MAG: hypothetical protein IRY88_17405, partial [Rubrobacteraceae bacterium]|nr:hypothetical protein [Rubrobacteraceae bacterium]
VEFLQPFAQEAEEVLPPRLAGVECLAKTFERFLVPGFGFLVVKKIVLAVHANFTPLGWIRRNEAALFGLAMKYPEGKAPRLPRRISWKYAGHPGLFERLFQPMGVIAQK